MSAPITEQLKKDKAELLATLAGRIKADIKAHLPNGEYAEIEQAHNTKTNNPSVTFKVKNVGSWSYNPSAKKMDVCRRTTRTLEEWQEKIETRHPKITLTWRTDTKMQLSISIKNSQSAAQAALKGDLNQRQLKEKEDAAKTLAHLEAVTSQLKAVLMTEHPSKSNKTRHKNPLMNMFRSNFEPKEEWTTTTGKDRILLRVRNLGSDYELGGSNHGIREPEMGDTTQKFIEDTIQRFSEKHPKVEINWFEIGRKWAEFEVSKKVA